MSTITLCGTGTPAGSGWINTTNAIGAADSTFASRTSTVRSEIAPVLNIPIQQGSIAAGSTINSVSVVVKGYINTTNIVKTIESKLVASGTDVSSTISHPLNVSSTNVWDAYSATPTLEQINNGLTLHYWYTRINSSTSRTVYIDSVTITVDYTEPASTTYTVSGITNSISVNYADSLIAIIPTYSIAACSSINIGTTSSLLFVESSSFAVSDCSGIQKAVLVADGAAVPKSAVAGNVSSILNVSAVISSISGCIGSQNVISNVSGTITAVSVISGNINAKIASISDTIVNTSSVASNVLNIFALNSTSSAISKTVNNILLIARLSDEINVVSLGIANSSSILILNDIINFASSSIGTVSVVASTSGLSLAKSISTQPTLNSIIAVNVLTVCNSVAISESITCKFIIGSETDSASASIGTVEVISASVNSVYGSSNSNSSVSSTVAKQFTLQSCLSSSKSSLLGSVALTNNCVGLSVATSSNIGYTLSISQTYSVSACISNLASSVCRIINVIQSSTSISSILGSIVGVNQVNAKSSAVSLSVGIVQSILIASSDTKSVSSVFGEATTIESSTFNAAGISTSGLVLIGNANNITRLIGLVAVKSVVNSVISIVNNVSSASYSYSFSNGISSCIFSNLAVQSNCKSNNYGNLCGVYSASSTATNKFILNGLSNKIVYTIGQSNCKTINYSSVLSNVSNVNSVPSVCLAKNYGYFTTILVVNGTTLSYLNVIGSPYNVYDKRDINIKVGFLYQRAIFATLWQNIYVDNLNVYNDAIICSQRDVKLLDFNSNRISIRKLYIE